MRVRKMKVWTDRDGKPVSAGEFAERWRDGIEKVTPLQQTSISLVGYLIIFVGIVIGIVATSITKQWWLLIILVGSFIVTSSSFVALLQKYLILRNVERGFQNG